MKRAIGKGKTDSEGLQAALNEICDEQDQRAVAIKKEWREECVKDLLERALVQLHKARRTCRPALAQVDPQGRFAQAIDGAAQVATELLQTLAAGGIP